MVVDVDDRLAVGSAVIDHAPQHATAWCPLIGVVKIADLRAADWDFDGYVTAAFRRFLFSGNDLVETSQNLLIAESMDRRAAPEVCAGNVWVTKIDDCVVSLAPYGHLVERGDRRPALTHETPLFTANPSMAVGLSPLVQGGWMRTPHLLHSKAGAAVSTCRAVNALAASRTLPARDRRRSLSRRQRCSSPRRRKGVIDQFDVIGAELEISRPGVLAHVRDVTGFWNRKESRCAGENAQRDLVRRLAVARAGLPQHAQALAAGARPVTERR